MPNASSSIPSSPGPLPAPVSPPPACRRGRSGRRAGRTLRRLGLVGCLAGAVTGCGDAADELLSAAASTVDDIRSGVLRLEISIRVASAPSSRLTIRGPFRLAGGRLDANLRYRRVEGSAEAEVRFVAVDGEAFVASRGALYELPPARGEAVEAPTVLHDLGFDRWAAAPTIVDDRGETITVVSAVDEEAALDGVLGVLEELEFDAPALGGLDRAGRGLREASMVVRVGERDGLLRVLVLRFRFRPERPAVDGASVAEAEDGLLLFSVRILRPNEPVRIRLPHLPPAETDAGP